MDVEVIKHLFTINVKGVYHYIAVVKFNGNGIEAYALVKTKTLVNWKDVLRHTEVGVEAYSNLTELISQYIDMSNFSTIICATTGSKVYTNSYFTHFQNGIRDNEDGYKINFNSIMDPEWDVMDVPEHIVKVQTDLGVTYITKFKENITLVA